MLRRVALSLGMISGNALAWSGAYEGQVLVQGAQLDKPNDPDTYVIDKQQAIRASWREAGLLSFGKQLKFEYGLYLIGHQLSGQDDFDHLSLMYSDPRNRTTLLDTYIQRQPRMDIYATLDRLTLKTQIKQVRVNAGRFPIEFSKSYIFRPNDIFAPSTYNQLDPFHKMGVDALQFSGPIAPLGEWKILGVLGYDPVTEAAIDTDGRYIFPVNRLSPDRSSLLFSMMNTISENSLQMIVGSYRSTLIFMASLEGEFTKTWGYRTEIKQIADSKNFKYEFSSVLGLDYRWSDQTLLFSEVFLNGAGFPSSDYYDNIENSPYKPLAQFGRYYVGLGMSSEITPLLTSRLVAQHNISDNSSFLSLNINYSITDHFDVSLVGVGAQGKPPVAGALQSEYGAYPNSLGLQTLLRW